jgi:PAS domain S-box-containing protein
MTEPATRESPIHGGLLEGERQVLELIATGAELPHVLDSLCRVLDEQSGLRTSIFLLDSTGERLVLAAGPQLPDGWRTAVASFPTTETACGAAVRRREQIVSSDISIDPLYAGYHDAAREAGIQAAWSTPFFSNHQCPLGTFAVYSGVPGSPDAAQRGLINRATHLASIAVERRLMEEGVRESERRFSVAFNRSPACMAITRFADGRFLYVNDKFVTMFGYSRDEIVGRTALGLGLWGDPPKRVELLRALRERGEIRDYEAQARTKAGDVLHLLVWMERIQMSGEECVLGIASDITDRKRAEEALRENERLLRVVLDTLAVGVGVMDRDGDIVLSNPALRDIWGSVVPSGRERYTSSKGWWHDTGERLSPRDWASARALAGGDSSVNEVIDIETFDGVSKIIQSSAVAIRDATGRITGAVIVNEDISARKGAEHKLQNSLQQLRALTARLMRAQDDERRRIAQMLHETTAQDLAALKMYLARLMRTEAPLSQGDRTALTESIELAERSMTGIRTLSYLLHPPFLDEAGLLSALRWYASGFADRSGIAVDLELPTGFKRLPQDVETTLFRVVQEALINIHHHADSPSATIRLIVDDDRLTLEIEDRGHGMPPELIRQLHSEGGALGVGLAGMRERLQQLGGTLNIESSGGGTILRAHIPLVQAG